jgi:hypothetical protein
LQSPSQPRLPRTSPRGQHGFLRLLTRIDLDAPLGLQFRGQLLSPGALFDPADLPRPAILLEYAGRDRVSPYRSRYAFDDLWIIWRYEFEFNEWIEVVRTHSQRDTSWTHDLAFLAHRRLFPSGESPVAERAQPVIDEIEELIGRALDTINLDARSYVLRAVDDFLAREIVRLSAELTVRKIGAGSGRRYPRIGKSLK